MKLLPVLLFTVILLPPARAQVSGRLAGSTGRPVPYASVLLLHARDSSLAQAALTDANGTFLLAGAGNGRYLLRCSSVGYQALQLPAFELNGTYNTGTLIMQEAARELGEVVVRAEKPLFQPQPGGLLVNVAGSIMARGSSALQVLERSPGVSIDRRNAGISLNGKEGVMVMLNGRLLRMSGTQLLALLDGMSADNIESISLTSAPGAGYDAEGNAGVINIILKKDTRAGTRGSITATAGQGWGEKAVAGFQISHHRRKFGLNGSYTFSRDRTYSYMFIHSTQYMPILGGHLDVLLRDTARRITSNHDAMLELELPLNTNATAGITFNYQGSYSPVRTVMHAGYNVLPDSVLAFEGLTQVNNRWTNAAASAYLQKKLPAGQTLGLQFDHLYFSNKSPSTVENTFLNPLGQPAGENDSLFSPRQKGDAGTTIHVNVAKADYTLQLTPRLKVEAGVKGAYTRVSSTSGIQSFINGGWVYRPEAKNDAAMREGVAAAYATLEVRLDSATRLVAGGRYEYAFTRVDNTRTKEQMANRKQGTLFPNLLLSHRLNERSELQLSYTKRIGRPAYNDLASFVSYSDPTAVYTGNTLLQPAITNNVKLNYQYGPYGFSLLFSRDGHAIARWQLTKGPAENLLYISPQNMAYQQYITFQAIVPVKVNAWWSMNYGFTGGHRSFKLTHTMQPVEKAYFGYSLNGSQLFTLPRSWWLEISGWYMGPSYNGSVKSGAAGTLNAGIKKELKKDRGTFQLSVTDVLRTMHFQHRYGRVTEEVFSIRSEVDFNVETRRVPVFRLSYTRTFGSGAARQRQREGAGEEKERVRKD